MTLIKFVKGVARYIKVQNVGGTDTNNIEEGNEGGGNREREYKLLNQQWGIQ